MKYFGLLLFILAIYSCSTKLERKIDLTGEWNFAIDSLDVGESEEWFLKDFDEQVKLPGSMVENGKGLDITLDTKWTGGVQDPEWYKDPNYAPYFNPDSVRFPFWLQPEKKYTGAAWYNRTVLVPEALKNKTIWLNLERPHWESTVWVNGQYAGMANSLATAHKFDISSFVKPGENVVSVRIDNRTKSLDVGENSHSISDHTQSNWNGIVGDISLQCFDPISFKDIKIYPNRKTNSLRVIASIENSSSSKSDVVINTGVELKDSDDKTDNEQFEFSIKPGENEVSMELSFDEEVLPWDEFNPNVYQLAIDMSYNDGKDERYVDFGFRDVSTDSSGLLINGRPLFLRGTLECAIFPLTGYPPTTQDGWMKVFTTVKKYGLNHVRFHSWCPPEAAFEVADKMGVYLQIECSSWANQSTEIGSGLPVDDYIYEESNRIVDAYGNHPSFIMMAYGNEPGGPKHTEYLRTFVNHWKDKDNRRLYTTAAGWPLIDENDYHVTHNAVRIQGWGEELNSIINSKPPSTDYDWTNGISGLNSPMVSHEIGQWCVYPNFKEIEKYTGVLKPKNFEIFKESLAAHHMEHLADSFLLASGKLQALCYKADIEAALRTPTFGGFQLLDLHDFPGQGTALVGVLDPFWEEKGYITAEEYTHFCNSTVPLVRLAKRVFYEGEILEADVEVAHFGEMPMEGVTPKWKIWDAENIVAEGELAQLDIPLGNATKLDKIIYQIESVNKPRKLTLEIAIDEYTNSWDMWVYPVNKGTKSTEVKVVEKLDNSTLQFLKDGGKVLLSLGKGKVAPEMGGNIGVGFSSIFWNTAWTGGQKPHTLGILCNPEHPALELFPTEYHSNWQWWDAMSHSDAIQLDSFSTDLKPIVRIIDDWVSNRRLALLFEAKVGEGKILVSGVDLVHGLASRPEAVQLKHSLLTYMNGSEFQPIAEIKSDELRSLLKKQ